MLKINGQFKQIAETNLLKYLLSNGYNPGVVAVEINGRIIKKTEFENTSLCDGDNVEIVSFVGGG